MIKKLEFNNLLISNRGSILSGRVHIISKLVRRIRKFKDELQMKLGDKLNQKLRKNVSIMEYIKKLKPNEIIINILLLRRSPEAILSNASSDLKEIGLALLAMNKNIKLLVDKLRLEFNLTDELYDTWSCELKQPGKRTRSNRKQKFERTQRQQKCGEEELNQTYHCSANRKIINKHHDKLMNRLKHPRDKTEIKQNKQFCAHKDELNVKSLSRLKLNNTNTSKNILTNSAQLNTKTDLHPSWLAKQRFKTIQPFQGKKISFDDEHETEINTNQPPLIQSKKIASTASEFENNIERHHKRKDNSGLHPSWVAKQKMKSSIAHFEGKRVVFND